MVVRMYGSSRVFCAGEYLVCPGGDHLIGVHIGGCAGTCLKNIQGEMIIELAFHDLMTCGGYRVCNAGFQKTKLLIDAGAGMFYQTHGADEDSGEHDPAHRELLDSPLGL